MTKVSRYKCRVCGEYTGRNDGHDRLCFECHLKVFENNFKELNPIGIYLMYEKFNEISDIKSKKYVTFFKRNFDNIKTWYDVLGYFNKQEETIDYICFEFKKFCEINNNENIHEFILNHETSVNTLCLNIGFAEIRKRCNMKEFVSSYSEDFIKDEYIRIKTELGKVPNQQQFLSNTTISEGVLSRNYGGYGSFIETLFKDDLDEYHINRKIIRSNNASVALTGLTKYTDDELKDKVANHVHEYVSIYKELPSTKVLQQLYNFDLKHFRRRIGMKFPDFIESIGYDKEKLKSFNRSEKSCLNAISKLLDCDYEPQKKFDWLIGCKNSPLFCDGYYEKYNLVVEFNGVQHYKPVDRFGGIESFKVIQQNDKIKEQLCKEHGLNFLIIKSSQPWYKEEWLKKKLIENKIL